MPSEEVEKQCTKCNEFWPADHEFFFRNSKNQTDGLNASCKACDLEYKQAKHKASKIRAQIVHQ